MNTERKEQILNELFFTNVENAKEILNGISEPDEKKCLTIFYNKIIKKTHHTGGLKALGDSIVKQLSDKKWAEELYCKAIDEAIIIYDYISVARSCIQYLNDIDLAKEICEKAAKIAKTIQGYINIAEFNITYLDDKSDILGLYDKAEKLLTDNVEEYIQLGISILVNAKNPERSEKLIRKAMDKFAEGWEFSQLYDELEMVNCSDIECEYLKDELLAESEKKAFEEACGVDDYIEIAKNATSLEDEALEEAESAASDVDGYLLLAKYHDDSGVSSQAEKFYKLALDEADPEDPEEIAKIKDAMQ